MGTWSNIAYDHLNRLSGGQLAPVTGSTQYLCWSYDDFGNRLVQSNSNATFTNVAGALPASRASYGCATTGTVSNNWATYAANNQIAETYVTTAPTYDAAGDVKYDGMNHYLYDAEGRLCVVENLLGSYTGYLYDAEGTRVAKGTVSGISSCPGSSGFGTLTNQYLLGPGGEQVTELAGSGGTTWDHTNAFAGGKLLGTYDIPSGNSGAVALHFQLTDWLGSRRVQTDPTGQIEETFQSMPFGDGLVPSSYGLATSDDATEHHLTGKERDSESGNDYFGARYYSSPMGRFLSPDWSVEPEPVPYANIYNPQSLNFYAYVMNNPLMLTDPSGHMHQECNDGATYSKDPNGITVVHATPCTTEPDLWDYQWWRDHGRNATKQAWSGAKQTWSNAVHFANSPRGKLLGKSIKHLTIGTLKASEAVGGAAAAPETGGASLMLTLYAGYGSIGDLVAGGSELFSSAFASDSELENASKAGDVVADVTTVSGMTTLIATDGNVEAANHAAATEDLVMTAGTSGFTGDAPKSGDWLGLADDTNDLANADIK